MLPHHIRLLPIPSHKGEAFDVLVHFLAHFSAQKARYTALNSPGSHCRDLSDLRSGDRSAKKGKPEDIEMYTSVHVLDIVTRKLQVILQYMTKKGIKS